MEQHLKTGITINKNRWTEEEDELLKENFSKMEVRDLCLLLKRTENAILKRRRILGIPPKHPEQVHNQKNWNEEELLYLRKSVNDKTYDEIAEHLNRSKGAIYNKVYELKLIDPEYKNHRKIKREQIVFILKNFNSMTDKEIATKIKVSEETVSSVRHNFGIYKSLDKKYKNTGIEIFVKNYLEELGIDYKYNKKLDKYFPDFQITGTNIIIEAQGDYFHCNPYIYKNGPKDEIQMCSIIRDYSKNCFYLNNNYNVLYVWEYDINHNPEEVKKRIRNILLAVQDQCS